MKLTKWNIIDEDLLLEYERLGYPDIDVPNIKRATKYIDTDPPYYRITTDTPVVLYCGEILHKMNISENLHVLQTYTNVNNISYYTVSEKKANILIDKHIRSGEDARVLDTASAVRSLINEFIQYDIAVLMSKEYRNGRYITYTHKERKRARRIVLRNMVLLSIRDMFR